jgi:hypothetical protein
MTALSESGGRRPRRTPADTPDSLPQGDRGTDVAPEGEPDNERRPTEPPDSLPRKEDDNSRP